MGLIDAIAEKASDKIAQHTVTSQPATAVSNVSPQFKNVPQGEMKNTPPNQVDTQRAKGAPVVPPETGKYAGQNTNPALNTMGAGESDVAPGGPPEATPATPPGTPGMIATPTKPAGPVVGQKATSTTTPSGPITPGPYDSSAVGGPDYRAATAGVPTQQDQKTDPVKDAASSPNFWKQLLDVAGKTGGGILEILGNIGRGLEGRPTITEQRLDREQQLRLQGNQLQVQKDLLSMNQGFQSQQQQLERDFQDKWNATTDANTKLQLKNAHDEALKRLQIEQQQANNTYALAALNQRLMFGGRQGNTTAAQLYNFENPGGEPK